MKQHAEDPTRPYIKQRKSNEHSSRDIKDLIGRIMKIENEMPYVSGVSSFETRKTCSSLFQIIKTNLLGMFEQTIFNIRNCVKIFHY